MPEINSDSNTRTLKQLGYGKIVQKHSAVGGCIAKSEILNFESGKQVFVKYASQHPELFPKEAQSLQALRDSQIFRVPEVLAVSPTMLVLELIKPAQPQKDFWRHFGRQLAMLHQIRGKTSGFTDDNFIGSTPQINSPLTQTWQQSPQCQGRSWPDFFMQRRLRFQIDLLQGQGHDLKLIELFHKAENNMHALLSTAIEPPSLLHGDLWSGNFLIDEQGQACLIDPAVYYGHRESDLAMTCLFGGFDSAFYASYHDTMPLADGYHDRQPIYQLYHVLNHLNLFGGAYFEQSRRILKQYV